MRMRLWVRISLTLGLNMVLLIALVAIFVARQNQSGIESMWFAPARERIRQLGSLVEADFPNRSKEEREKLLHDLEAQYRVTLVVYQDTGELVAGPDLDPPQNVVVEVRRSPSEWPAPAPPPGSPGSGAPPTFRLPPRPSDRAMFMVKQQDPSRYWIGVNTPIVENSTGTPIRHVLVVVAPSLLASSLFIDWGPWILGALLALLVTVICWTPLVRRLTHSIEAMRQTAGEIAEGHFEVKVPADTGDELGQLGTSIRRMAEQLSRLVHGQRRFLADVAHELCAPLSRIQLSAGILEQRASEADKEHVQRLERDVAHMSALVGDLMSFTKGAARMPDLSRVTLADVVSGVVEQEGSPTVRLSAEVDPSISVLADREYLKRAVGNVLRNAILYAGKAGPIRILADRNGGLENGPSVRLRVEDSGPGLPEEELEAVFQPFYRPDTSRTPGTGGFGLGLAIVRSCIEACGGRVICRNRQPSGLEVDILLREG